MDGAFVLRELSGRRALELNRQWTRADDCTGFEGGVPYGGRCFSLNIRDGCKNGQPGPAVVVALVITADRVDLPALLGAIVVDPAHRRKGRASDLIRRMREIFGEMLALPSCDSAEAMLRKLCFGDIAYSLPRDVANCSPPGVLYSP